MIDTIELYILLPYIDMRDICWCDFIKHIINIVLCWNTWGPICFKLGMMLDMTELCNLIPVWMTLTHGHRKVNTCAVILL